MTVEALQYINDCMESLSIPYEFMQWTKDLSFPYFIGEYTEVEPLDESGKSYGRITDVFGTGANDVYEITKDGKKYYIPAIPSVVLKTDVEAGKMTVFPMEGLFDED